MGRTPGGGGGPPDASAHSAAAMGVDPTGFTQGQREGQILSPIKSGVLLVLPLPSAGPFVLSLPDWERWSAPSRGVQKGGL